MDKTINPEMIVLARQSRGMTQSELAVLISIFQGKLSKMESEIIPFTVEVMQLVSKVTNYPENFFYFTDKVYGMGISTL